MQAIPAERALTVYVDKRELITLMTLAAVLGSGTGKTVIVIGLLSWPLACRLVRARIMSIREMEFVAAARTLGAGPSARALGGPPSTVSTLVVLS